MVRDNIPVPSFSKNLRSYLCPLIRQPCLRNLKAPMSVSISPRGCYYPRSRSILSRRWQLWSRSSHPAPFVSEPSIPPVASVPGPRGSSITGSGRPGWFHFGRAPFGGSNRYNSSCRVTGARSGGPRQISDFFPQWVPLSGTLPG